ncbi:MAG: beta-ketoacyl-[acyl-carrier-protein] synthase II [Chloroflexi bacterium]|nr:beta-ketoacyl-[acyl-carrier-protein] synthase II [Chloroflexota bacterium]|tara:strand:+ start:8812 stop:10050 length:1239 start_codon:yes stop_codon:yes gene_type:complete
MINRVVVTSVGIISPIGLTSEITWSNLIKGKSGISQITTFDTRNFETTIAAEVKNFDPIECFGKKEARRMDRFVQLAGVATLEAIENSGIKINPNNQNRISVMIASGIGGIITLSEQNQVLFEKGPSRISPFLVPMMLPDMASGQISMMIGAKGPNYSVVSACASSGDTIGLAYEAIKRDDVDVVFAGGSEAAICPIGVAGFSACKALSKSNDKPESASRPFDLNRDGFVLGEGSAILVLEKLENAINRGVKPIAEIVGYGASADAHHITQPAPGGEGGARAMNKAINGASISKDEINYINAHGTSTPLNDKFETMAMKSVFGDQAYNISINSTKSMVGHLLGASGAIEAAVTSLSIKNSMIHPTANLENSDPECDLDYTPSGFKNLDINYAMSNSFGFGGHNTSLIFKKFE